MSAQLTVVGNPGHGNGPVVLLLFAAEALQARARTQVNLILPDTGVLQREILGRRRTHPEIQLFYDRALAAALYPVTLRDNDFARNLRDIQRYGPGAQQLSRRYVEAGLDVSDEEGKSRRFGVNELTLELNVGSRIRLSAVPRAFYLFPCLLSDLLRRLQAPKDGSIGKVLQMAEELEQSYEVAFLPCLHTFSWDSSWTPPANALMMPYTRYPRRTPGRPPQEGILAMPSGVGTAGNGPIARVVEQMLSERKEAGSPSNVYYPLGAPIPEIPAARPLHPDAIFTGAITAVVARAGWGTFWECLSAQVPLVAIPPLAGDDPEIQYNLRALQASGLAVVYQEGSTLLEATAKTRETMRRFRDEMQREFGTLDGFQLMADEILRRLGIPPQSKDATPAQGDTFREVQDS